MLSSKNPPTDQVDLEGNLPIHLAAILVDKPDFDYEKILPVLITKTNIDDLYEMNGNGNVGITVNPR